MPLLSGLGSIKLRRTFCHPVEDLDARIKKQEWSRSKEADPGVASGFTNFFTSEFRMMELHNAGQLLVNFSHVSRLTATPQAQAVAFSCRCSLEEFRSKAHRIQEL